DGVELGGVEVGAVPLTDAGPAGVGQHRAPDRLEVGQQPVALDGGAGLLGAGGDHQLHLGPQPLGRRLPGDGGGPGDVLVGAVGAGADQRRGDVEGPALGPGVVAEVGQLVGPVGGVGPVDHGTELVEVDLDHLVEVGGGIGQHGVVGAQVGG